MRKLILIAIILAMCDFLSYRFLVTIASSRRPFVFEPKIQPLLIQKKEIVLNSRDEFDFGEFFIIYSFSDPKCRVKTNENHISVMINDFSHEYPYRIREKETKTVETVIYREIYAEKPVLEVSSNEETSKENELQEEEYEKPYFRLLKDHLSFPQGSDISDIIMECQSMADTNVKTTIDYSSLNPNHIGQYEVCFYTESGKYTIIVDIV